MARQWTNICAKEPDILEMRKRGMSRREIAVALGLELKQIENFITRYNKRQRIGGMLSKRRGRPRKYPPTTQEEMALRIKELEREVALLRSFLRAAGRM